MGKLEGKVAIVTGAGQGQGRVVAQRLARDGASVVAADIIKDTAESVARQINSDGGQAMVAVANLSNFKQTDDMVRQALDRFGQIDILCNVAGGGPRGEYASLGKKFWETTPEQWAKDIDANLYTCLNCCRAVIPHMIGRRYGKIVNWEGAAVLVGLTTGLSVYMAAKGAIYTFTKCLAKELGPHNITVNSIGPGIIVADPETRPPMQHLPAEQRKEWLDNRARTIPLGRVGSGEDVSNVVSFLVSDEASWISAQSICVSGGESAR